MVYSNSIPYHVRCYTCGEDHTIIAEKQDIISWMTGAKYIQDALPYLSAADRELLISNTCDKCWKELYGEDEE